MWLGTPRTLCERLTMFDEQKAYQAIRECMEATVAKLGIPAVRRLSFFPSARTGRAAKKN